MAKAFKKGDLVTFIANWDSKGTVSYRHAVVYSCGVNQMVLTDAKTGDEMGRNFKPELGFVVGTFPRMTDEQAIARCLKAGAWFVDHYRGVYKRCLEGGHGEGYNNAIRRDIEALHEPRAGSYADLTAEVHREMMARNFRA